MNIDAINKDKIKICLSNAEINTLFGGYDMIDYEHPRSKTVINTLLSSALPDEMLPLDCKKVLIEVHPVYGGCTILFTRIFERGKRLKKVQKGKGFIMIFKKSEDLISLLKQNNIKPISNKLLDFENRLALQMVFDCETQIDTSLLKEYGNLFEENSVKGAYISEHSKIISKNAIEKIRQSF